MKLVTQEQVDAHDAASRRGALEGTAVGGVLAAGLSYFAHARYPAYRKLPLPLKTLGAVILIAPALAVQAERRGLEYDRSQWEGETVRILDHKEASALQRWDSMSLGDKIGDWSFRHQYSLIFGGWAGSLAVAGLAISRNKYQTYPQKIVQARMWAQGLTIGLLIVAGALSAQRRAAAATEGNLDHSWKDVLEQKERDLQHAESITREGIRHRGATAVGIGGHA
ncbi:hypothetical protein BKA70DRAFT_1557175 [Coprinopsis sp. MPI-PUGE-AT-0042]|nr:hypothetical protein BKA70DRAFT_1557175 [Coprinopsis sp. MPI-PUGE-AT-0042]